MGQRTPEIIERDKLIYERYKLGIIPAKLAREFKTARSNIDRIIHTEARKERHRTTILSKADEMMAELPINFRLKSNLF